MKGSITTTVCALTGMDNMRVFLGGGGWARIDTKIWIFRRVICVARFNCCVQCDQINVPYWVANRPLCRGWSVLVSRSCFGKIVTPVLCGIVAVPSTLGA